MMEWEEQTHENGRMTVIRLKGEIDLQYSPKLREILQSKVAQKVPLLLLDFAGVKYIDSSGLATLVEYFQHSRDYAGRMALAGATERVKSIFNLVRLDEIFQFYPSVEQARSGLLDAG